MAPGWTTWDAWEPPSGEILLIVNSVADKGRQLAVICDELERRADREAPHAYVLCLRDLLIRMRRAGKQVVYAATCRALVDDGAQQHEINRRDLMLAELQAERIEAVAIRDRRIEELQPEYNFIIRGWRRFLVRRG